MAFMNSFILSCGRPAITTKSPTKDDWTVNRFIISKPDVRRELIALTRCRFRAYFCDGNHNTSTFLYTAMLCCIILYNMDKWLLEQVTAEALVHKQCIRMNGPCTVNE